MTIPASSIVQVNPGVLSAGGNPLALNGVILSKNLYIPVGGVQSFSSASAVSAFFGAGSTEYALSQIYFAGYDGSTAKPGTLFFAPFVDIARAAWLQSGSWAGLALADLQAAGSGTLIITVDGVVKTSSSIALGSIASFAAAAIAVAAAFTGSPITCVWDSVKSMFIITSATTGATSTITVATGTISAALKLTTATGAVLSQGSAITTPGTAMDSVKTITQNWASFTTIWEPVTADKQLFAVWASGQNSRFIYVAWDTDAQAIVANTTTAFGALAKSLAYDGVLPVYNTKELAVFVLGMIASIDFSRRNGRVTASFKSQAGISPTALDQTTADVLLANGYSFYGSYATAVQGFIFMYNGQMPGKWKWLDTFVDQVYLNSQFKTALLTLLTNNASIPYNDQGFSLIRAALIDPIVSAINFGTVRTGVVLSAAQIAQVNAAAGRDVASIIQQQGYYLQVLDPGAQVRGNRGTPVINFWYTDGGAVQQITVASIDIM